MPKSVFFMDVEFSLPPKDKKSQATRYGFFQGASYIGERPGVVYDDKLNEHSFNEMSPNDTYAKYISERPNSHGLFTQDKDEDIDIKAVANEVLNHNGIVWRFVLSVKEEDAIINSYAERDPWEKLLREKVSVVAAKMGIPPSNVKWVAAFHEKEGHPHTHLMIWEKEPERLYGKLTQNEIKSIKQDFVREIYREERQVHNREKTLLRDTIVRLTKGDVEKAEVFLADYQDRLNEGDVFLRTVYDTAKELTPVLNKEVILSKKIVDLARLLPEKGRLSYGYMPKEVKEEVIKITEWILKQPKFVQKFEDYLRCQRKLSSFYLKEAAKLDDSLKNASFDLKKRMSQLIIKSAGGVNYLEKNSVYVREHVSSNQELKAVQNNIAEFVEMNKDKLIANSLAEIDSNFKNVNYEYPDNFDKSIVQHVEKRLKFLAEKEYQNAVNERDIKLDRDNNIKLKINIPQISKKLNKYAEMNMGKFSIDVIKSKYFEDKRSLSDEISKSLRTRSMVRSLWSGCWNSVIQEVDRAEAMAEYMSQNRIRRQVLKDKQREKN